MARSLRVADAPLFRVVEIDRINDLLRLCAGEVRACRRVCKWAGAAANAPLTMHQMEPPTVRAAASG
jgi:hypothetical protein